MVKAVVLVKQVDAVTKDSVLAQAGLFAKAERLIVLANELFETATGESDIAWNEIISLDEASSSCGLICVSCRSCLKSCPVFVIIYNLDLSNILNPLA